MNCFMRRECFHCIGGNDRGPVISFFFFVISVFLIFSRIMVFACLNKEIRTTVALIAT